MTAEKMRTIAPWRGWTGQKRGGWELGAGRMGKEA